MVSYVYKFEDIYGNILYVGKTDDIDRRIAQHFGGNGHIKGNCYRDTARVYYMKFKGDGDALLVEQYMIGRYDPPYNKLGKSKKRVSLKVVFDEKWVLYKVFKAESIDCTRDGIGDLILGGGILLGGLLYLLWLL